MSTLLFLFVPTSVAAQAKGSIASLIAAVVKNHPSSGYRLIEIGTTAYLIKGTQGKVVRTKRVRSFGGICSNYASVWIASSDTKMREKSSGGGEIWKKAGNTWIHIATAEGEWSCSEVNSIPAAIKRCLGVRDCF